ncbi:MAG: protein phosphatase [Frankiales bacterium]|jgi:anti-sigma regulatory factor (Ser/Thr protein kinase)|nr:protein phosphatase [Frankiales bacterium]
MTGAVESTFAPDRRELSSARHFVRGALAALSEEPGGKDLTDSLVTAANELATNAVLHGRTDFTVRVLVTADCVRIDVVDENVRMPQPCLAPAGALSGRGLAIVDAMGFNWGADRRADGKSVWLEAQR